MLTKPEEISNANRIVCCVFIPPQTKLVGWLVCGTNYFLFNILYVKLKYFYNCICSLYALKQIAFVAFTIAICHKYHCRLTLLIRYPKSRCNKTNFNSFLQVNLKSVFSWWCLLGFDQETFRSLVRHVYQYSRPQAILTVCYVHQYPCPFNDLYSTIYGSALKERVMD